MAAWSSGIVSAQIVSPAIFCKKIIHYWYHGKSRPEICANYLIFIPLPKVNNHLFGENLSNLVTLMFLDLGKQGSWHAREFARFFSGIYRFFAPFCSFAFPLFTGAAGRI
jgi:hypothetical protein